MESRLVQEPNLEPIVSTGNRIAAAMAVPASSAMMLPGIRRDTHRQHRMIPMVASASSVEAPLAESAYDASIRARPRKSPGSSGVSRPNRSRIWVLAMRMAMPLVKPMTTGRGMYFTAVPSPVTPSKTRITPAMRVHMNNPSMPYAATMPDTTTTKAPVGPAIWTREPPSAEIVNPAMTAQYRPFCGGTPELIANAMASGNATSPTVTPATRSLAKKAPRVALAQAGDQFR